LWPSLIGKGTTWVVIMMVYSDCLVFTSGFFYPH